MRWKGRRISTNVEDRRGGGAKAGGISILGLIVALWFQLGLKSGDINQCDTFK